ncbi:MAG: hypothetical protein JNK05_21040 [Myxococcales bacterium]|nr:hypothetical protein [Myxococcales bacterium]
MKTSIHSVKAFAANAGIALALVATGCTVTTTGSGGAPVTTAQGGEAQAQTTAPSQSTTSTGGPCSVVRVYTDTNFAGEALDLAAGRFDVQHFESTQVPNDSIRSVCVPAGWRVTLYMDGGFAGEHVDLAASTADLGQYAGSTSSVVVSAPGQ